MNYNFNINIAKEYGVNEAIIINNFIFWITKNKANGKNVHDGHTWTFNSARAFKILFPFWSEKQIRGILGRLVEREVLIKGNYNKKGYDRTIWYAFKSENKFINIDESLLPQGKMELPLRANGTDLEVTPIPYINTVNKQDNKQPPLEALPFINFWDIYDNKKKRYDCERKWKRLTATEKISCLEAVPLYVKSTPVKKFRMHPLTYLNAKSWEDEIIDDSKPKLTMQPNTNPEF